jgi:hypothetical protein
VPGNNSPYRDIGHAIAEGPTLVGCPQQVIDKILSCHAYYRHDLQSVSLPTTLPFEEQLHILERLATEVTRSCAVTPGRAPPRPDRAVGRGGPGRLAAGVRRGAGAPARIGHPGGQASRLEPGHLGDEGSRRDKLFGQAPVL